MSSSTEATPPPTVDWTFFASPAVVISGIISLVAIFSPWYFMLMALVVLGIILTTLFGLAESKPDVWQKFTLGITKQFKEITKNPYYATMGVSTVCTILFATFNHPLKYLFALCSFIVISLPSLLPAVAHRAMAGIKKSKRKIKKQSEKYAAKYETHKSIRADKKEASQKIKQERAEQKKQEAAEKQEKQTPEEQPLTLIDDVPTKATIIISAPNMWEDDIIFEQKGSSLFKKATVLAVLCLLGYACWYSWDNHVDEHTKVKIKKMGAAIEKKSREVGSDVIDNVNKVSAPTTGFTIENNFKKEIEEEKELATRALNQKELAWRFRLAVSNGDTTQAQKWLNAGAEINFLRSPNDLSALHYAASMNNAPMVSFLLGQGADATQACNGKRASELTSNDLIKHLLENAESEQL